MAHNNEEKVTVQVTLEGEYAKKFLASVKSSDRSQRGEARIRLQNSLDSFEALVAVDHTIART